MIPAAFDYHRPNTIDAAVGLLAEHGEEARVVAGGHSLIPMMKLRMAYLSHLVDLRDVQEMQGITVDGDTVTLGAMVTQHELITSDALSSVAPILREASLQIADPQVRYMGTIGGNVANGDPGNDIPGLMQALDAKFVLAGPEGRRTVDARGFYEAAYMTAREDEEILTHIRFRSVAGMGYAYEKQKRKIGDYATAAAAVLVAKDGDTISEARVAMTNLSDTPIFSEGAGAALVGTSGDGAAVAAAIAAMQADIDPAEDNRGPVEFKRHVAGVMLSRAINSALSRA